MESTAEGNLKVNIDASVFDGANNFSVGMVTRDCQGQFIRGRTMKFAGRVSVPEAELVGILEALRWIEEFPEQVIIVESDSMLSVNAIRGSDQNRMELGDIIEMCRSIVGSRSDVSIVFARKHANRVAYAMARLPCMSNSFVDVESPPLCVLETLLSDV